MRSPSEHHRKIRLGLRVVHCHQIGGKEERRVSELVMIEGQPKAGRRIDLTRSDLAVLEAAVDALLSSWRSSSHDYSSQPPDFPNDLLASMQSQATQQSVRP